MQRIGFHAIPHATARLWSVTNVLPFRVTRVLREQHSVLSVPTASPH